MRSTKAKTYSRIRTLVAFLLGATLVAGFWMITLYNQIEDASDISHIRDAKTKPVKTPDLEQMATKRAEFMHEQVHPHSTEREIKIIRRILENVAIDPDAGTMELIDTMAEHYNKTSLMIAIDISRIADGEYKIAANYGVNIERRLDGENAVGTDKRPLAIKNMHYVIIQTWQEDPSGVWKIGQKFFNLGEATPKRRMLPDNSNVVVHSFLDVLPQVMKAVIFVPKLDAKSSKLHRIR